MYHQFYYFTGQATILLNFAIT